MAVDYFGRYFNDEGFKFTELIIDDFFQPVRLLFKNRHYVSASKLPFVAIVHWATADDAQASMDSFADAPVAVDFMGMMNAETMRMTRYDIN